MPPVALSHPETSDSPAPDFAVQQAEQFVGDGEISSVGQGAQPSIQQRVHQLHQDREAMDHANQEQA